MAKAVILQTDKGIRIMGTTQCCNGAWWDAEGCFKYCNENGRSEEFCKLQAEKLIYNSSTLAWQPKGKENWYRSRENFIDIELDFECDQTYIINKQK
jgi:hypothetical protein